jgi:hypothetical protein
MSCAPVRIFFPQDFILPVPPGGGCGTRKVITTKLNTIKNKTVAANNLMQAVLKTFAIFTTVC